MLRIYTQTIYGQSISAGTLNTNLYYKDNSYLIEKGNEKLAKAVITALYVGSLKRHCKNQ